MPGLNWTLRVTPKGLLCIDRKKIAGEVDLDGEYLLRCSAPHLPAEDIALGNKQLLQVERGLVKTTLELRPVHHRLEERIRALRRSRRSTLGFEVQTRHQLRNRGPTALHIGPLLVNGEAMRTSKGKACPELAIVGSALIRVRSTLTTSAVGTGHRCVQGRRRTRVIRRSEARDPVGDREADGRIRSMDQARVVNGVRAADRLKQAGVGGSAVADTVRRSYGQAQRELLDRATCCRADEHITRGLRTQHVMGVQADRELVIEPRRKVGQHDDADGLEQVVAEQRVTSLAESICSIDAVRRFDVIDLRRDSGAVEHGPQ